MRCSGSEANFKDCPPGDSDIFLDGSCATSARISCQYFDTAVGMFETTALEEQETISKTTSPENKDMGISIGTIVAIILVIVLTLVPPLVPPLCWYCCKSYTKANLPGDAEEQQIELYEVRPEPVFRKFLPLPLPPPLIDEYSLPKPPLYHIYDVPRRRGPPGYIIAQWRTSPPYRFYSALDKAHMYTQIDPHITKPLDESQYNLLLHKATRNKKCPLHTVDITAKTVKHGLLEQKLVEQHTEEEPPDGFYSTLGKADMYAQLEPYIVYPLDEFQYDCLQHNTSSLKGNKNLPLQATDKTALNDQCEQECDEQYHIYDEIPFKVPSRSLTQLLHLEGVELKSSQEKHPGDSHTRATNLHHIIELPPESITHEGTEKVEESNLSCNTTDVVINTHISLDSQLPTVNHLRVRSLSRSSSSSEHSVHSGSYSFFSSSSSSHSPEQQTTAL